MQLAKSVKAKRFISTTSELGSRTRTSWEEEDRKQLGEMEGGTHREETYPENICK